jgi:hypothetical protein
MRTNKVAIFFVVMGFVFLLLPLTAGAIVDFYPLTETNLERGSSGAWDDTDLAGGTVIKNGSTFEIWYEGQNSTPTVGIGHATSADGLTWTKSGSNPVLTKSTSGWDSAHVGKPAVILDGVTYKMWFSGTNDPTGQASRQIGYATSADGVTWTKYGSNPVLTNGGSGDWDGGGVWGATVIKDEAAIPSAIYKMWYVGFNSALSPARLGIGHATSPDGIIWTKRNLGSTTLDPFANSDPVFQVLSDITSSYPGFYPGTWADLKIGSPVVIKVGSYYRMWFGGQQTDSGHKIGFAYSKDGVNWRLYDGNPVVSSDPAATFTSSFVDDPMVIKDGNTYKMWFVGGKDCPACINKIGYASSPAYASNYLANVNFGVATNQNQYGIYIHLYAVAVGPSPLHYTQIQVDGPNGFQYLFGDADKISSMGYEPLVAAIPSFTPLSNNSGTYTLTINTDNGLTATQSHNLTVNAITAPMEGGGGLDRSVNDDKTAPLGGVYAGTTTPTFKWKPYLGDGYYYRVIVNNWKKSAIWYNSDYALGSTKGGDGYMSVTVPPGILKTNTPYQWQVEVSDSNNRWRAHNKSISTPYYFYTGTKGTSNFLVAADSAFVSERSYRDGNKSQFWVAVQNLAPWDFTNTDPDKFRILNENGTTFFQFNFDPNNSINNALSSDPHPFYYSGGPFGIPANAPSPGYEFYIKDSVSGNPSSFYKTFTDVSNVPRASGSHYDCSGACMTPTLYWQSTGPAYKHRVRITDWNNLRVTYTGNWMDGLTQGQEMSVQVPAGTLKNWCSYWWWIEVIDSTMNSRTRSQWKPLTTYDEGQPLYANFAGAGIWKWDGSAWSQVTPNSPTAMAVSGSLLLYDLNFGLYGNFGTGAGIWKWDGTNWSQVTPNSPSAMVASSSLLYGNFGIGAGIWKLDGTTWSQVTPNAPIDMAASGSLLYGNFGTGAGIWKWDGSNWSQITPNAPTAMAVAGSLLYGNFGAGAGIWKWDGVNWSQVTPNSPTAMTASGALLYGNFGTGAGIWKWDGSSWSQVTPNAPQTMAASGDLLYGDFGTGAGIWKWDGTNWSQVTSNDPTSMVVDAGN